MFSICFRLLYVEKLCLTNIPEGAHWSDLRATSTDVGQALQSSMREIESANPNLEGIFGDAQWTNKERFTDARLKDIIEHFSKHTLGRDVSEGDLIGQAGTHEVTDAHANGLEEGDLGIALAKGS